MKALHRTLLKIAATVSLLGTMVSALASNLVFGDDEIRFVLVASADQSVSNFHRQSGLNTVDIDVNWSVDFSLEYAFDVECFVGVTIEVVDNLNNIHIGIGAQGYEGIIRWQNIISLSETTPLQVEYATALMPSGCWCFPTIYASGQSSDPMATIEIEYLAPESYLSF
jgi:hypothetical protein